MVEKVGTPCMEYARHWRSSNLVVLENFLFYLQQSPNFHKHGLCLSAKKCIFAENFLDMAKIQIKSETRQDLGFFPSSFDDYVPKDDKVRIVDSIVRSMDSKPSLSTYDGIGAPLHTVQ